MIHFAFAHHSFKLGQMDHDVYSGLFRRKGFCEAYLFEAGAHHPEHISAARGPCGKTVQDLLSKGNTRIKEKRRPRQDP